MKKCKCTVTPDGECEDCKGRASTAGVRFQGLVDDFVRAFTALEEEFKRKLDELKAQLNSSEHSFGVVGSCERCTDKYADFAMSKMIVGFRGGKDLQFGSAFIKAMQKKFAKRGIKKFPLTDKAWAEISKGSSAG